MSINQRGNHLWGSIESESKAAAVVTCGSRTKSQTATPINQKMPRQTSTGITISSTSASSKMQ
jgi:hypothetical protein